MTLGKVIGTVVATIKHPDFDAKKLLVIQPIDIDGNDIGKESFLAVDRVDAGVGDRVLVLREGSGLRQLFNKKIFSVRSAVVGVVDHVERGSWLKAN